MERMYRITLSSVNAQLIRNILVVSDQRVIWYNVNAAFLHCSTIYVRASIDVGASLYLGSNIPDNFDGTFSANRRVVL